LRALRAERALSRDRAQQDSHKLSHGGLTYFGDRLQQRIDTNRSAPDSPAALFRVPSWGANPTAEHMRPVVCENSIGFTPHADIR
jgi:hypothetical protein